MDETPAGADAAPKETDSAADAAAARNLRLLRRLVTLLTSVMIVGIVVVVILMVIRLNQTPAPWLLPEAIVLPEGASAKAVTMGEGFVLVLTTTDEVLVYDAASGKLRQRTQLTGAR